MANDGSGLCPFLDFANCKKEQCELWHANQEKCIFLVMDDRLKDCKKNLDTIVENTTP
jgi:hypothetical protein